MLFIPVGFYFSLKKDVTYGKLFVALYGLLSSYFACVMVRLMLVIAPAACVLAAIGISEILRKMSRSIRKQWFEGEEASPVIKNELKVKPSKKMRIPADVAFIVLVFIMFELRKYVYHSTWIAAEAYSSPSIIMDSRRNDGTRLIIDDYREAYYWLK
jgi:dolichyl-diphosphooligosaccharide---protein glycosyltransferase